MARVLFDRVGYAYPDAPPVLLTIVRVDSRTPYRMAVLNRMMADLDLGIRGLVYMEGGPEASLIVRDGGHAVTEIGSWEDGFNPNDDNRELWDIPSVIGFRARD